MSQPTTAPVLLPTPRFAFGQVVATPGALAALDAAGEDPRVYLGRHARLERGELGDEDHAMNQESAESGDRILSSFKLGDAAGTKLWVITEGDRSATTVLLPSEY